MRGSMLASGIVFFCLLAYSCSAPQAFDPFEPSPNDLDSLEEYLGSVLESGESPLAWVQEDPGTLEAGAEAEPGLGAGLGPEALGLPMVKRTRYYRRYPWKRQNGRNYDPDGYLCSPSREDVFQLLMAIHEARNGNQDRTLSFCNRRRPAKAVFTNVRFLGRRKK